MFILRGRVIKRCGGRIVASLQRKRERQQCQANGGSRQTVQNHSSVMRGVSFQNPRNGDERLGRRVQKRGTGIYVSRCDIIGIKAVEGSIIEHICPADEVAGLLPKRPGWCKVLSPKNLIVRPASEILET